ncbi:MAG: ZIP family metal transporter [Bacteroidia bacterium]|nr:ZIP family metal transporter [Bacteroidia bacterium]
MGLWEYIILVAGVLLSGAFVLFVKVQPRILKLLLAFSGAFLFSVSIMHLLPEVYSEGEHQVGIFILAGFILQIIIEFFSEGIEHGHIHVHSKQEQRFPFTMMIALSVHSFLEGLPLAETFGGDDHTHHSLFTGIILHNIPISIALCTLLLQSGTRRTTAILWLLMFALMTPAGALAGEWLSACVQDMHSAVRYPMALVVGIFLHISTTILFESSENHRFNIIKLLIILAGAGIGILL